MTYLCHEFDLPYNAKHRRMQIRLYAEDNFESIQIFARKYLMQRNLTLHEYIDTHESAKFC